MSRALTRMPIYPSSSPSGIRAVSRVIRGSLLVIPVEQSLLYVQPLYIAAQSGGVPELKRVIVAYGNSIAMEEKPRKIAECYFWRKSRRSLLWTTADNRKRLLRNKRRSKTSSARPTASSKTRSSSSSAATGQGMALPCRRFRNRSRI